MARVGLFGLSLSSDPIWNLLDSPTSVRSWVWRRTRRSSADGGGLGLCPRRSPQGLSVWHLSRDNRSARCESSGPRSYYLIRFHGTAQERRWAEGKICREPLQAIEEMAKRYCQNGKPLRICDVYTEGGPLYLYGYRARLSTPPAPSGNEGLVHLQVRRSVLPMHSPPIRLGTLCSMVYGPHVSIRDGVATAGISSVSLSRRLSHLSFPVRRDIATRPLRRRTQRHPRPSVSLGLDPASQGRMASLYSSGASWSHRRFGSDDIHSAASKGSQGERGHPFITRSTDRASMGQQEGLADLLRSERIAVVGVALGALLHSFPVLGYVAHLVQRWKSAMQAQSPSDQRPHVLEKDALKRACSRLFMPRPVEASMHTDAADIGFGGTLSSEDMRSGVPGRLCSQGIWSWRDRGTVHYATRAPSNSTSTTWEARPSSPRPRKMGATFTCGQSSRSPHHQQLCLGQPSYDARIATTEVRPGWPGAPHQNRMDTLRCQQIPRCVIATLPPRRLADTQAAAAFRAGWYARSPRPVQIPFVGREPGVHAASGLPGIGSSVEHAGGTTTMPMVDLIGATIRKLTITRAPAMLLIPDWRRQPWHQAAIRIANQVTKLPHPPEEVWEAQRTLNPA